MAIFYQNLFCTYTGNLDNISKEYKKGLNHSKLGSFALVSVDYNSVEGKFKLSMHGQEKVYKPSELMDLVTNLGQIKYMFSLDELFHKVSERGSESDLVLLSSKLYKYADETKKTTVFVKKDLNDPQFKEMASSDPYAESFIKELFTYNSSTLYDWLHQIKFPFTVE